MMRLGIVRERKNNKEDERQEDNKKDGEVVSADRGEEE